MESRPRRSSLLAYGDADSGVDLEPVRREIVRPCAMALKADTAPRPEVPRALLGGWPMASAR